MLEGVDIPAAEHMRHIEISRTKMEKVVLSEVQYAFM